MGVAALGLALVAGVFGTGGSFADSTDATWHAEESAVGTLTAGEVPAPTLTQECDYEPGLLGIGARVEIFWSAPEGYTLEHAELEASTSGLGSVLAPITGFSLEGSTEPTSSGYTTEVPANLLGGLLGLGSELELAIFITDPDHGWTSESASVASNAGLIGGIGGNCRNLS